MATTIPDEPALDCAPALLREGYTFISTRCRRFGTDLFRARLMGTRAVCIHGAAAAELFHGEPRLKRGAPIPRRLVTSFFGTAGLPSPGAEAHRGRRSPFLSLMRSGAIAALMDAMAREWRSAVRQWERASSIVLLDEVQRLSMAAACSWVGVPLAAHDVPRRARDCAAMIDGFGGMGPRLWRAKLAGWRTKSWLASAVARVRKGRPSLAAGTALNALSRQLDLQARPLDARIAAAELIDVIRPTVAVSWYVAFAALALDDHPEERDRLRREPTGNGIGVGLRADAFMQEVRRFYPFTPFLAARVAAPFSWKGHLFEPGTLVLLDVYGTDHDPRCWEAPDEFRAERFDEGEPYGLAEEWGAVHRGADESTVAGHPGAGEWITMHSLALALHFLTRAMTYELVPGQDLRFSLARIPARPASGVMLRNVRATARLDEPVPLFPSAAAVREAANSPAAAPGGPSSRLWTNVHPR
jgi:fatty-acid peroxygenase